MALLLDGQRLTPQSRTERLLQAITFDTVLKSAPVASIAGVPLALIAAKDFTIGYATHLGVPQEFVKADPTDAIAPFNIIAGLLLIALLVLHEVDHLGVAEALKSLGRAARSFVFILGLSVLTGYVIGQLRDGEDIKAPIASILLLYVLLWWVAPFLFFVLRQLLRVIAWMESFIRWSARRRGGRWLPWVDQGTQLPPELLGKLIVILVVLAGVLFLPRLCGTWAAMWDSHFAMIDRGKDYPEAILGVYGDRAFLGHVEDDAVVVEVQMVAVADLRGKPISTEEIGPLRYDPYYFVRND
jgi:hypothetical protein